MLKKEAEDKLRRGIEICRESYPIASVVFQALLARLLAEQGLHEEAVAMVSIDLSTVELGHMEQSKFLCNKAVALHLSGATAAAQECLAQALKLTAGLKLDPRSELAKQLSETTLRLGTAPREPARDAPEWRLLEGQRALELGRLESEQANYEQAEEAFQQAIHIFREIGKRSDEAEAIGVLANTCLSRNQTDRAKEYYLESLQIARETGHQKLVGRHLGNLGNLVPVRVWHLRSSGETSET